MLYWGRHGVSKDTAGALRWFEESALQMKDASAVYDYSILLMKVPRGIKPRLVSHWNRAVDMASVF